MNAARLAVWMQGEALRIGHGEIQVTVRVRDCRVVQILKTTTVSELSGKTTSSLPASGELSKCGPLLLDT